MRGSRLKRLATQEHQIAFVLRIISIVTSVSVRRNAATVPRVRQGLELTGATPEKNNHSMNPYSVSRRSFLKKTALSMSCVALGAGLANAAESIEDCMAGKDPGRICEEGYFICKIGLNTAKKCGKAPAPCGC